MARSLLIAYSERTPTHYFRQFMAELGYELETAAGGLECVSKLRERRPDVLVLEEGLLWGGADGVLAQMRNERQAPAIPVVLVCDGVSHAGGELSGWPVACRLRKPYLLSDLIGAVTLAERIARAQTGPLTTSHSRELVGAPVYA